MIDFNWTEIFFLAVAAVVLFGPERLPEMARKAARIVAYLRQVGDDARGQLRAELGPEFDDLRLTDLNPKTFVARHLLSAEDKDDLLAIRDEFRGTREIANDAIQGANAIAPAASEPVIATTPPRPTRFDPEAT